MSCLVFSTDAGRVRALQPFLQHGQTDRTGCTHTEIHFTVGAMVSFTLNTDDFISIAVLA